MNYGKIHVHVKETECLLTHNLDTETGNFSNIRGTNCEGTIYKYTTFLLFDNSTVI